MNMQQARREHSNEQQANEQQANEQQANEQQANVAASKCGSKRIWQQANVVPAALCRSEPKTGCGQ